MATYKPLGLHGQSFKMVAPVTPTGVRDLGGGATEPNHSTQTGECGSSWKTQTALVVLRCGNDGLSVVQIPTEFGEWSRIFTHRICAGALRARDELRPHPGLSSHDEARTRSLRGANKQTTNRLDPTTANHWWRLANTLAQGAHNMVEMERKPTCLRVR